MLRARGFEEYLPVLRRVHVYDGRTRRVDTPLFPGYVFSRFDVDRRVPVLTVPGVLYIVGPGRVPASLEPAELAAIERILKSGLTAGACPFISAGERLLIEKGPLRGLEGVVAAVRNSYRLIVSVTMMERSVYVEIDRSWVHPSPRKVSTNLP